jgi:hypothetical protein
MNGKSSLLQTAPDGAMLCRVQNVWPWFVLQGLPIALRPQHTLKVLLRQDSE